MFVTAFGVCTAIDPILILMVDLFALNFNCSSQSTACHTDYTSGGCKCFNGDFIKLWLRMTQVENSGVTGIFITVMLYVAVFVLSCLLLHEYLVHVHKDSR